ncbi:MAG: ribose transport system permease protein [Thermomicrobiales bacterium]|jgi:ribose transport system permease protein|nr:ribose transport system permease protein [Thermomicrobiales bacterium]MEA2597173.1 ribose transport system permease protein [Thermomicrobiales bacterium]
MTRAITVLDRLGLFAVILAFWAVFVVFANGFLTSITIFGLSRSIAVTAVVGLAQMVVLSIGQMNLAVGAIGGMVAVLTGWLMQGLSFPIWAAVACGLAVGAMTGWLNGWLVTRTGINSFVVTLGMASVITGLVFILTKAEAFRDLPRPFVKFGKKRLMEVGWLEVSPLLLLALGATAAIFLLYRGTAVGRQMLATGANERAAGFSGVPVARVVQFTHALSGLLAGLGGIMLLTRLGSALPSIGDDWLLPSFAAPIVGGTLLSGGAVAVVGTLLGAVLIDSVSVGLTLMNVPSFWIQLFVGLVLLLAVLLDRARTVAVLRGRAGAGSTGSGTATVAAR